MHPLETLILIVGGVAFAVHLGARAVSRLRQARPPPRSPPLVRLTASDTISGEDACEGVLITGSTGSGKSSGPADAFARGLLRSGADPPRRRQGRAPPRAGMVILPAKLSDRPYWERVCCEEGRSADLIVFDGKQSFNWLGYELRTGSVASASAVMSALVEVVSRNTGDGGERFWVDACNRNLRAAIELASLSLENPCVEDIYSIVTTAASSAEETASEKWRAESDCARLLMKAITKHGEDHRGLRLIANYFLSEIAKLSDRTRSIIDTMSLQVLSPFMTGTAAGCMSGPETTASPDDALNGKIVLIDFPALLDEGNQLVLVVWKVVTQRACLRRPVTSDTPLCCIFADEAHLTALPGIDAKIAAVARSHRLLQINIVQSVNLLYSSLGGGEKARQEALAWMGNLQVKVFCQQTDWDTCEFFSRLCGSYREVMISGSSQPVEYDPIGEFLGKPQPSASVGFSEQYQPVLRPEALAGFELRRGGPNSGGWVDAFIHAGGRQFSNGKVYLKVAFKQK